MMEFTLIKDQFFHNQFCHQIEIFHVIGISQECGLKQVIADTTLAVSSEMGAILLLPVVEKCPQNWEQHSGKQENSEESRRKILSLNFVLVNVANCERSHIPYGF